jgi:Acetyl-coenzyme A synthetase N-terminus
MFAFSLAKGHQGCNRVRGAFRVSSTLKKTLVQTSAPSSLRAMSTVSAQTPFIVISDTSVPSHPSSPSYPPIQHGDKSVQESAAEYRRRYKESIEDPQTFWRKEAQQYLDWFTPFQQVKSGGLSDGDINWFSGGTLNASYNW